MGQSNRRSVRHFKLHGNDGGDVLLEQALGHAGKGVGVGGAPPFAGVENGQAQGLFVVEKGGKLLAADFAPSPVLVHKDQNAVAGLGVKTAVADEVEDVIFFPAQLALQSAEGGGFGAVQHYPPRGLQIGHSLLQAAPLLLHIQQVVVAGAGNHHQHPQGRLDAQGFDAPGQVQIPHQWGIDGKAEKAFFVRVIEILPGQIDEFRCAAGKTQTNAQPRLLLGGLHQTAVQCAAHTAQKDRIVEPGPKFPGRGQLRGVGSAGGLAFLAHTQDEIFQFQFGEGKTEFAHRRARRRGEHPRPIARVRAFEHQVEFQIFSAFHLTPPPLDRPARFRKTWQVSHALAIPDDSAHRPATPPH